MKIVTDPPIESPLVAKAVVRVGLLVLALLFAPVAHAFHVYDVNTTADLVDDGFGATTCHTSAGTCSLRAAIMKANTLDDLVIINVPVGQYDLSIPPSGANGDDSGDLNLTPPSPGQQISILGAGAKRTIIDGSQLDDVFHISTGRVAYISGVTIRGGNNTGGSGGGIRNNGNLTISDSAISDNSSNFYGGGICNVGTLRVARSTISGNFALSGGGIFNTGTLYAVNDTVSFNFAGADGGGIYSNQHAFLYNTSVVNNAADADNGGGGVGGGVAAYPSVGSQFFVVNTLIAGNVNAQGASNCTGTLDLYGFNRLGEIAAADNCFAGGNGLTALGPVSLTSIGLLQDNGGPTRTHALLPGSEAIDTTTAQGCIDENGAFLTTDQRGAPRVAGLRCDAGAFEYGAVVDSIFADGFN